MSCEVTKEIKKIIERIQMGLEDFGKNDNPKKSYLQKVAVEGTSKDELELRPQFQQYIQYAIVGDDEYAAVGKTLPILPPGKYSLDRRGGEVVFIRRPMITDELILFPGSVYDDVVQEIKHFWTLGKQFKRYGFLHRRGVMFYGPQGSGKSCVVQQILSYVIEQRGLVISCDCSSHLIEDGLQVIRKVEPDRFIACLFEDIDSLIETYGEDGILHLLDGDNQIDKVLNIATTNYPERLDRRIVARPRRFDRVIKIGMPGKYIRLVYLKKKLGINDVEAVALAEATDGFSFAALADLIISIKCFGKSEKEALALLKELENSKPSSNQFDKSKVGFSA